MVVLRGIVYVIILKLFLIQVIPGEKLRFNDGDIIYEYNNESVPLGEGGFGTVFKGVRITGNETEYVAFKQTDCELSWLLAWERDIYKMFNAGGGHDSIPKFYHYVSENSGDKPVLVIELLGKSLGHIWKYIGQFSTITVMRIGLQVLDILEYMHEIGVLFHDIHDRNLAVGINNDSRIYALDFGFSIIHEPIELCHRRHDLKRLSKYLINMPIGKDTPKNDNGALKEFDFKSQETGHFEYEDFRKILRTELEKYQNDPNFEKFDWQISHADRKMRHFTIKQNDRKINPKILW